MNNVTEKVIQKIEAEKIKPASKSKFFLKRFILWFLILISVVLASLVMAVVFFLFTNLDWDIAGRFTPFKPLFIFLALPYFWLLLLAIFSFLVYRNYRHTKYGYRLKFGFLILIFFALSLLLGFFAYRLDLGHRLEKYISEKMSFYNHLDSSSIIWNSVDRGLLAGKIIEIKSESEVVISDLNGQTWHVILNEAVLKTTPSLGEKIKIIGQKTGDYEFLAKEIRPWCGCNKCLTATSSCGAGPVNKFCGSNCGH